MKVLKVTLFIMLLSILEGVPYLFFAFCAWEFNWIPDANWICRAIYGVIALSGLVITLNIFIEWSQEINRANNKNEQ